MFLRHKEAQVTVSDVRSAEALANDIPALLEEGIMVEGRPRPAHLRRQSDRGEPRRPLETPELVQVKTSACR